MRTRSFAPSTLPPNANVAAPSVTALPVPLRKPRRSMAVILVSCEALVLGKTLYNACRRRRVVIEVVHSQECRMDCSVRSGAAIAGTGSSCRHGDERAPLGKRARNWFRNHHTLVNQHATLQKPPKIRRIPL